MGQFSVDCEDLFDLSNKYIRPLADDVADSARALSGLATAPSTWGMGFGANVQLDAYYDVIHKTFTEKQWEIATTLNDVADALRGVAENYLRIDEHYS